MALSRMACMPPYALMNMPALGIELMPSFVRNSVPSGLRRTSMSCFLVRRYFIDF